MLGENSGQVDVFNNMIFERLIPKDHLLVKIDSIIDFSFVYDKVKDKYSPLGRKSKDPVMMLKILLLEYLYTLSDGEVRKRTQTDIAFRWFLGLAIDDEVPDDTTISHFRAIRLGEEDFNSFFNEIVKKCIEYDLIKTNRFMIDTTDVAANVNYPSDKKLICDAFRKTIKEMRKFNEGLAAQQLEQFEKEIDEEYGKNNKVNLKKYLEIALRYAEYLYLKTYDELQTNEKYKEAFGILWDIIDQYTNNKTDKIVSVVDPEAKIAHKSRGNIKRGYKDHIIVDEDSEIIISSIQTPFNVGDEKKLIDLVNKAENDLRLIPKEISADKAYGTVNNRAYLKDKGIISNINFYEESSRDVQYYGIRDFNIPDDLKSATCPNGITTKNCELAYDKSNEKEILRFKFETSVCRKCPLNEKCMRKYDGKIPSGRKVEIYSRYDAVKHDMKRVETEEFKEAMKKRSKVERRFATLVRNHGLRRCRYLKLKGAKTHITLANMACNIIRMVNLLCPPNIAMSNI